ncbi:MAG TPA: hypothetical protein DIU15_04965 [Deltaproteobacteria bacterium]|nr:hypothetical protein [Deltaproteobacteria bacterium]HCP45367.1 hypothetical protein [Deltaproteobacteria bacterium]
MLLSVSFLLAAGGGGGKKGSDAGAKEGGDGDKKAEKKGDSGGDGGDGVQRPLPWEIPREGELGCEDEEILLLRDLRLRARELDRRETVLEEREAALRRFEEQTAETLDELQGVRTEILKLLEEQQEALALRVASLAKVVDGMKAKDAAKMLAGIEEGVALQLLQRIKAKNAGKILGYMPPERAQKLAEGMTELPPDIQKAARDAVNGDGKAGK